MDEIEVSWAGSSWPGLISAICRRAPRPHLRATPPGRLCAGGARRRPVRGGAGGGRGLPRGGGAAHAGQRVLRVESASAVLPAHCTQLIWGLHLVSFNLICWLVSSEPIPVSSAAMPCN